MAKSLSGSDQDDALYYAILSIESLDEAVYETADPSSPSSEEDAFLRSIMANMNDGSHYAAFADWLDEQGRHRDAKWWIGANDKNKVKRKLSGVDLVCANCLRNCNYPKYSFARQFVSSALGHTKNTLTPRQWLTMWKIASWSREKILDKSVLERIEVLFGV